MRILTGLIGVFCFTLSGQAAVVITNVSQFADTGAILQPGGAGFQDSDSGFVNSSGLFIVESIAGGQTGNPTVSDRYENNLTISGANTQFDFLGLHSAEITAGAFGFLDSDAGLNFSGGAGPQGFGGAYVAFTIDQPMAWSLSGIFDTTGVAVSGPVSSFGNAGFALRDGGGVPIQEFIADSPGGPASLVLNGSGLLSPGNYEITLNSVVGLQTTGNGAPAFGGSAGWNSTFTLTTVPEPSSLLLGIAVTGFAAIRRRRKN